jgi:hypothetical protein
LSKERERAPQIPSLQILPLYDSEGDGLQAAKKYPTTLGKFSPSYTCMGDKEFARCLLCHPNMCPHECPHFLGVDKHFNDAELLGEMCNKQRRWKDERILSCLTDEEFLAFVVPSHRVE